MLGAGEAESQALTPPTRPPGATPGRDGADADGNRPAARQAALLLQVTGAFNWAHPDYTQPFQALSHPDSPTSMDSCSIGLFPDL